MARTRRLLPGTLLAALAGLTALVGGCGADHSGHPAGGTAASPATAPATTPAGSGSAGQAAGQAGHNDQDATFAGNMISHHQQAIEMADLVAGRSTDPKIVALGKRILAAQAPEIAMMGGWLQGWGMAAPEDMSGMDMGGSMPGMMSAADLKQLAGLTGADFDQRFLTMMIAHHQGAVVMAKDQLGQGRSTEAKELAQRIADSQSAEIAEMTALLR